jgi:hypothetical protein
MYVPNENVLITYLNLNLSVPAVTEPAPTLTHPTKHSTTAANTATVTAIG